MKTSKKKSNNNIQKEKAPIKTAPIEKIPDENIPYEKLPQRI